MLQSATQLIQTSMEKIRQEKMNLEDAFVGLAGKYEWV